MREEIKSNITFEYETNKQTSIVIKRNNERIGRIWSQLSDGTTPYPHNKHDLDSIQICGFDKMSEIWGCGPFDGKKDCVIQFIDINDDYYKEQLEGYKNYVKGFTLKTMKELKTGAITLPYAQITIKDQVKELKSFQDWMQTGSMEYRSK